jgi:hypothetical protein
MKKMIYIFFIVLLSISLHAKESVDINTFFTEEDLSTINNNKSISRMYIKNNARGENSDKSIKIPRTKYLDEDFSKYEIIADEKGFLSYDLNKKSKIDFYNTLAGYSKLEGMKYYSRRAGKVEQLIKECFRVESLSGKKHDDIVYTEIKPKVSNMFFQEDNKFGKLFYKSDLYNEGDNFVLINTCLQPLTKLIFSINEKEEYKICSYFIYDNDKKGYFYYSFILMRVRVNALLTMKQGYSPTTFSNRLRASSVHLAKLIGLEWDDKLNPWPGKYDTY